MNLKSKSLLINSILIAITTSLITTILHEGAHYVTALAMGVPAELHHNYVSTPDETLLQTATIISAAGPLFSLLFGILALVISVRLVQISLFKLFMLWLGMQGVLTFFGYLLIAPIAAEGDTGKVFSHLGFPIYLSAAIAVISFIFINKAFSRLARYFAFYKAEAFSDKNEDCRQLLTYPIFASIILVTLLNLPVIIWVSLLPTIFMPMTYFATMGAYKRLKITGNQVVIDKISIPLSILAAVTALLFRYLV
ncbi:hypothetical protein ACFP1I_07895 [Dyadobacter subterraneus]|uniref:Uncharacterized protein n=1 Tax=Dyadobacter subterraneus TaxID=2773304 RepID=A0ABR9WEL6_9BACT|nr:hypothetical protein [Dyadobacter subterraneus]MBE9463942.1 hypothetical protein [Dyadobacter subterraneus]